MGHGASKDDSSSTNPTIPARETNQHSFIRFKEYDHMMQDLWKAIIELNKDIKKVLDFQKNFVSKGMANGLAMGSYPVPVMNALGTILGTMDELQIAKQNINPSTPLKNGGTWASPQRSIDACASDNVFGE